MLPKKHLSSAQKRKKIKQEDWFIESSQKGAIHIFQFQASSVEVSQDRGHEHNVLDNIDLDTVVKDFASRNAQRHFLLRSTEALLFYLR